MTQEAFDELEDEAYFRTIPWCLAYLDDPSYIRNSRLGLPRFRRVQIGPTYHTLFAQTLNTPDTIPAATSLYKQPAAGHPITEGITLMALGSGMNGHPDTAHGGTVATILDEVAGRMLAAAGGRKTVFTAYLNITYRRPVRTPQVVLCRGKIVSVTGRKTKVVVEIQDQGQEVLASAEALFVQAKEENHGGKL